ncbi:MAG: OmpA family protein [Candidatus Zixiibacteriota bacterium]|nr:MAG: OmpA family protein [candidate division Zixibacteria bacterium]
MVYDTQEAKMRQFLRVLLMAFLTVGLIGFTQPVSAQLGGLKKKVKDKVEKKADDKVDQKLDEAVDKAAGDGEKSEEGEEEKPADAKQPAPVAKGGTATAEDMTLYTKYDFIPGDKVIFYDDMANEEIGEFPSRWNLGNGVFEIVKQHGRNWIMCTDEGAIMPKVPVGLLPEKYTVELEFYNKGGGAHSHWYYISWLDGRGSSIGSLALTDGINTQLNIQSKILASKQLSEKLSSGRHVIRIMATKTTMKCYIDNVRIANVPAMQDFKPMQLRVTADPYANDVDNPMLIGAFRYAEGGKTLRQQLDEEGKIVTHGILFDSGSDKIKGESYKTLADIGGLLTEDAALRLSIEGHTDSDGADDANLKLSQNRAASVRTYLIDNYKVDGGRLETKGFGESKPIDVNTSAEGKANNRRVELVKL